MKNLIAFLFILGAAYSRAQDSTLMVPEFPTGVDNNAYFVIPDTDYTLYRLPEKLIKPEKWLEMDKQRAESNFFYFTPYYSASMDLTTALSFIDSAKQFNQVLEGISWCIYHYDETFPFLVARLSNKTKIGLKNTADLIILGRMDTGDLRFYGHGGVIREDLFTIAGRASAALNQITGESFAVVNPDLTKEAALNFKQLWLEYITKL